MNEKIIAIGGAVIKTARKELIEVIKSGQVEMLIHNGGSIFHDFQLATEKLEGHSHKLDNLLKSHEPNRKASELIWSWIEGKIDAPKGSATYECQKRIIPVLMFTGMACDFWQLFDNRWDLIGKKAKIDFDILCSALKSNFHYVCMGSAVIHPEVFIKAIAVSKPTDVKADVVDFIDMYRPRTRVSKFGTYYKMTHKEYLERLL